MAKHHSYKQGFSENLDTVEGLTFRQWVTQKYRVSELTESQLAHLRAEWLAGTAIAYFDLARRLKPKSTIDFLRASPITGLGFHRKQEKGAKHASK